VVGGSTHGDCAGTLSQVERGLTDPSLNALRRLASPLSVTLMDLFDPEDPVDVAVIKREERIQIRAPHGEMAFTRLSPGFGTAEILDGELVAGGESSAGGWTHDAEESIVVREGCLTVSVGSGTYRLEDGDTCRFDSRIIHRCVNESTTTARFLLVVAPRR
jgi:mannose-6-phosphate isomerase-like protein (cupin superfamily)